MNLKIRKSAIYEIIIIMAFVSELLYWNISGSTVRMYFIMYILIMCLFVKNVNHVFSNKLLSILILYYVLLFLSSMLSADFVSAFKSSVFYILNTLFAIVVYLMFRNKKMSFDGINKTIYIACMICVCEGLMQYLIYKVGGIAIGSPAGMKQIAEGQISGLFTEANIHGKLVCWSIVWFFPVLLQEKKTRTRKKYIYLLILDGITLLISPTRAAMYAVIVTLFCAVFLYIKEKKSMQLLKYLIPILLIVLISITLVSFGYIQLGSGAQKKFANFLLTNVSDVINDGSGAFRYGTILNSLTVWTSSYKNFMVGVGSGQLYSTIASYTSNLTGNDFMTITTSTGVLGLICFLSMLSVAFSVTKRDKHEGKEVSGVKQQILFSLIFTVVMFVFSSFSKTPMCWLAIGIAAFLKEQKGREVYCAES